MSGPPLSYRPVVAGLAAWVSPAAAGLPGWLRELRGKSGVYVIRSKIDEQVFYVGESHSDRLHDTIARHFRAWSGPTAGPTYPREVVEVAVKILSPGRAVVFQDGLIRRLRPRDNRNDKRVRPNRPENPF